MISYLHFYGFSLAIFFSPGTNGQAREGYCGKPGKIIGGTYSPVRERYQYNDFVVYRCNPAYKIVHEANLRCVNGEWSHNIPLCAQPTQWELLNTPGVSSSGQQTLRDGNYQTCVSMPANVAIRVKLEKPRRVRLVVINYEEYPRSIDMLLQSNRGNRTCVADGGTSGWQVYYCMRGDDLDDTIHFGPTTTNFRFCELAIFSTEGYGCFLPPKWNVQNGEVTANLTDVTIACDPGYRPRDGIRAVKCPSSEQWGYQSLFCDKLMEERKTDQLSFQVTLIVSAASGATLIITCTGIIIYCVRKRLIARRRRQNRFPHIQRTPPQQEFTRPVEIAQPSPQRHLQVPSPLTTVHALPHRPRSTHRPIPEMRHSPEPPETIYSNPDAEYHDYSTIKYSEILERVPLPRKKKQTLKTKLEKYAAR